MENLVERCTKENALKVDFLRKARSNKRDGKDFANKTGESDPSRGFRNEVRNEVRGQIISKIVPFEIPDFVSNIMSVFDLLHAAQESYPNREAAHVALQPYVYNFIKDSKLESINKSAVRAALKLCNYGGAQNYLRIEKLDIAIEAFNKGFIDKYNEFNKAKFSQAKFNIFITEESKVNGSLFECLRRLLHYGNYIQAGTIVSNYLNFINDHKRKSASDLKDFCKEYKVKDLDHASDIRRYFSIVSSAIDNSSKNVHLEHFPTEIIKK